MKGKRTKRRAHRKWAREHIDAATDPTDCDCNHDGMPALWHSRSCVAFIKSWSQKP